MRKVIIFIFSIFLVFLLSSILFYSQINNKLFLEFLTGRSDSSSFSVDLVSLPVSQIKSLSEGFHFLESRSLDTEEIYFLVGTISDFNVTDEETYLEIEAESKKKKVYLGSLRTISMVGKTSFQNFDYHTTKRRSLINDTIKSLGVGDRIALEYTFSDNTYNDLVDCSEESCSVILSEINAESTFKEIFLESKTIYYPITTIYTDK